MYCPECKTEYRPGFSTCADCHVNLVDRLPPEDDPESIPMEAPADETAFEYVLGSHNPADIMLIKSVLEGEGITYYFQGERINLMRPLMEPVRLMVKKDQVQDVLDLIKTMGLPYPFNE